MIINLMQQNKEDIKNDDFRMQLIIDSNCNLACEYCVLLYKNNLYKEERSVSYQTLDKYIDFFINNYDEILKYYRKITLTLFGGEPLLSIKKIEYLIQKLSSLDKINFVIHTNGILINKNTLSHLSSFNKNKISFIISIDGDLNIMLKYRLSNKLQFYKIIRGIKLLKEFGYVFLFSPSIMKPTSTELFKNYIYLYKFGSNGFILNPVTAVYAYREIKSTKEILKGIKMFLNFLKNEEKFSEIEIINYLGLPLNINDYREFLKFGMNVTGDIDGTVHAMSFAWNGFDDGKTYNHEELKTITLGNIIFQKELLLKNICRTDLYSDTNILKVAIEHNKKRTLPDWDLQNMLSAMLLKYFSNFYMNNKNIKKCE